MTQGDIDCKAEKQIATVEITVEGKVVYSKSVFCDDIEELKDDLIINLYYYDEAK